MKYTEHEIGSLFTYKGKLYKTYKSPTNSPCDYCDFKKYSNRRQICKNPLELCRDYLRIDNIDVYFKKVKLKKDENE